MTDTHRTSLRDLTVIGLACLAVVACSPKQGELGDEFFPHAKWDQIPPAPQNMVEVVTLRHVVTFSGSEAGLGASEHSALNDFIDGRLMSVKSAFAQRGLVSSESVAAPGAEGPAGNEVAVMITRAVVIPPDCAVPTPEPTLRPDHPFGCHVNSALGMMVANPQDLVEGRELGPGDAAQTIGAIERYREDKIKEINQEETTN